MRSIKRLSNPVNLKYSIMVYQFPGKLLHTLLPPRCLICRQPSRQRLALCAPCEEKLPFNKLSCRICAQPLSAAGLVCGDCQLHTPEYDLTIAPLAYRDDVRQLIIELKFQGKLRNAKLLAQLFLQHLAIRERPHCLIPIPLHPKRIRERGYNQSLEIARQLAAVSGIRIDPYSTRRKRNTHRQADLGLKEKRSNVRGAFEVIKEGLPEHVAIVDDVMTSGHTVNEFARVLKRSGVKKISVWAMARAGHA
jgi:ComF family protein